MKIETTVTATRTRQKIAGLPNSAPILKALVDDRKKAGYRLVDVEAADRSKRRLNLEFVKAGSET